MTSIWLTVLLECFQYMTLILLTVLLEYIIKRVMYFMTYAVIDEIQAHVEILQYTQLLYLYNINIY